MGLFRRNSLGQPLLDDEGELLPETPTRPTPTRSTREDGGFDANGFSPGGSSTFQSPGMEVREKWKWRDEEN